MCLPTLCLTWLAHSGVHIAWTGLFNVDAANRSHETALHLVARNGSCALATVGLAPISDLIFASMYDLVMVHWIPQDCSAPFMVTRPFARQGAALSPSSLLQSLLTAPSALSYNEPPL
jgi:hypothetical protein